MNALNSLELKNKFARGLRRYYKHGSPFDMEDAIEYAIEKILSNEKQFATEEERDKWIFGTSRNYLRHCARDAWRWLGLEAAAQSGSENAAAAIESADNLEAMLAVLNRRDSLLLIEKYVDGFSISEIARSERCNASTLRSRHERALQTIRKYFPNQ